MKKMKKIIAETAFVMFFILWWASVIMFIGTGFISSSYEELVSNRTNLCKNVSHHQEQNWSMDAANDSHSVTLDTNDTESVAKNKCKATKRQWDVKMLIRVVSFLMFLLSTPGLLICGKIVEEFDAPKRTYLIIMPDSSTPILENTREGLIPLLYMGSKSKEYLSSMFQESEWRDKDVEVRVIPIAYDS